VRVDLGVHGRALLEDAPVEVLVLAPLEHHLPRGGGDARVVHDAAEVQGDGDAGGAAVPGEVVKPVRGGGGVGLEGLEGLGAGERVGRSVALVRCVGRGSASKSFSLPSPPHTKRTCRSRLVAVQV